jgi:phosphoribosylaminoimidazolecarboxamide formyltransferase/IMP cyclohydrolase
LEPTVWARAWIVGSFYTKKECNEMKELMLKYGCNPHQKSARIYTKDNEIPFQILNGSPSYINLLDALNGWQLVKELKEATGVAAAASFKHVSPAGAAIAVPLTDDLKKEYFVQDNNLSDIATAYIRARGADRMSSYGDFAALSEECDVQTAKYLSCEFSDGIIAPSYSKEALDLLKTKRKGNYLVIQIDPYYLPNEIETKEVYGITFEQKRNEFKITEDLFGNVSTKNKIIPADAKRDLMISLIILKYTQSNSVCYVKDGQAIGIGAGQQSRIHCTRLAGNKADVWFLRQNPKVMELPFKQEIKRAERDNAIDVYISDDDMEVLSDGIWENIFTARPARLTKEEKLEWLKGLTGVSLGSDAFFPFGDNIERAVKSGVAYIAQPGGSIRDGNVIDACDKYNIAMAFTGVRLFHH